MGHSDELPAKIVVGIPGKAILLRRDTHCGGVGYQVPRSTGMSPHPLGGLESHKILSRGCDL